MHREEPAYAVVNLTTQNISFRWLPDILIEDALRMGEGTMHRGWTNALAETSKHSTHEETTEVASMAPPAAAHHHKDDQPDAPRSERASFQPIAIALGISAGFMVVEAIGGYLTNSLALLADAGHMLTDVAALAFSLVAIWLARRPATAQRSYGNFRAEVLAAVVNSTALIAISIYIFWEAIQRLSAPPDVRSGPMLVVAIAGLGANLVSEWILSRGGGHQNNLNTRGAYLHVISDALGSVGAILAAVIMLATGWYLADPLLSGGIGLLIVWSSWRLLRESVDVLMESTPEGIDPRDVASAARTVAGVTNLHDLHIWTVTSGLIAMSAHVGVVDLDEWTATLRSLSSLLRERFGIAHITLQPEPPGGEFETDEAFLQCSLDTEEGRNACLVASKGSRATAGSHPHAH